MGSTGRWGRFFIFVALVFYLKRLLYGEIGFRDRKDFFKGTLKFAAGPVSGIALFGIHLTIFMWGNLGFAIEYLSHKYFVRAGMDSYDSTTKGEYYQQIMAHVVQGYGSAGKIIRYITIIFVVLVGFYSLIRKLNKSSVSSEARRITQLAFIVVAPCILQLFVFIVCGLGT
ncbi:MAG: hypothetical protein ACYDGS_08890 [Thermoleophilia bacterium]